MRTQQITKPGLILTAFLFFFGITNLHATQYFISPTGSDSNTGNLENPFRSVVKAQEMVNPGDTVYIRGGEYVFTEDDISVVEKNLFACITSLNKSGKENQLINYWAYPGEQPVFKMDAVKPANKRVVCFWVSGDYIHLKGIEITGVQITITSHTESYCVYSWGNHNIFENISMHDNKGTGLRHRKGGYNLFLNCDAYRNHDDVSEDKKGANVDGFGCHPTAGGKGNVFRGCRAWLNSDDGFDCIRAFEAILFDSCWAGFNGYSATMESLGDGNGFKAGGYAYDEESRLPEQIPQNTLQFCLAVHNKANGFYSNHHLSGNTWINNSAYMNQVNFNMVNRESPQSQNINTDGYDHTLVNNLGFRARSSETAYIDPLKNTLITNSFDMNFSLTEEDFAGLDEWEFTAPRKSDGSLPDISFMHIPPDGRLTDAGTNAGFPFHGDNPEPGAFEQNTPEKTSQEPISAPKTILYPNPAKNILFVNDKTVNDLSVISLNGTICSVSVKGNTIDISTLENATYILRYRNHKNQLLTEKFLIYR